MRRSHGITLAILWQTSLLLCCYCGKLLYYFAVTFNFHILSSETLVSDYILRYLCTGWGKKTTNENYLGQCIKAQFPKELKNVQAFSSTLAKINTNFKILN